MSYAPNSEQAHPAAPNDQLFLALSTRWRRDDGSLAFGISEGDIAGNGEMTLAEWRDRQVELKALGEQLGLELISYNHRGETWWCFRSLYAVPPELDEKEMALLAVFFYRTVPEDDSAPRSALSAEVESLKALLVEGDYMSSHSMDRVLRQLRRRDTSSAPGAAYGPTRGCFWRCRRRTASTWQTRWGG